MSQKSIGPGPTHLPPPLPKGALRVVALGGIGEIGRNMTVFEYDGRLLVVDCGVLFPEDAQPGVDLILPDFRPIEDRIDDIEALVLTHGHEDHIGAVPFLLRCARPAGVGSRFTLALIAAKCREHRLSARSSCEVAEGAAASRRAVRLCEFFAVNHSIPDALAVAIRTPAGLVLHTGDIKLDQLPLDGRLTDLARFLPARRRGRRPVPGRLHQRRGPRFRDPGARHRAVLDDVIARAAGSGSSWPVSPATSTGCSRCSTPPIDTVARCAFVGRSMVRNMSIAPNWDC